MNAVWCLQFYKDEGGKKNCLSVSIKVKLETKDADGTKVDLTKLDGVSTIATICYETGEAVEQNHQVCMHLKDFLVRT